MAKRAEKTKIDRYPHINLVPFILETTGRPGHHAKKFISILMKDADNPPFAIQDTWSAIHSSSTPPCPNNNSQPPLRDLRTTLQHTLLRFYPVHLVFHGVSTVLSGTPAPFCVSPAACLAMWACCDDTSSDDDEHNTRTSFSSSLLTLT